MYCGADGRRCEGSGADPLPFDPETCGECLEYQWETPGLWEACCSVGIERGKPGTVLLYEVLEAYHQAGHREETLP